MWVRQLQKNLDVESISLDHIDTTVARRVETDGPIMDSVPNWLEVDPKALEPEQLAVAGEGEVEEEEQEHEAK